MIPMIDSSNQKTSKVFFLEKKLSGVTLDPNQETGDQILITGPEARHITTVLRIQPGTVVELYNSKGGMFKGEILHLSSREVTIHILSRSTRHDREHKVNTIS